MLVIAKHKTFVIILAVMILVLLGYILFAALSGNDTPSRGVFVLGMTGCRDLAARLIS